MEIKKAVAAGDGDGDGHEGFFIATREIHGDGVVPEDEAAAAGGNQAIPGYGAGYSRQHFEIEQHVKESSKVITKT